MEQQVDQILNQLYSNSEELNGLKALKKCMLENNDFMMNIIDGMKNNKITSFSEQDWAKLENLNMRGPGVFTDVFKNGMNIGACTVASKIFSYIFDNCYIAGGVNKYLIGTKNSSDGRHTWIIGPDSKIYDTTFMLVIDREYEKKLGYNQENIYDPCDNSNYYAAKVFANDTSINKGKSR